MARASLLYMEYRSDALAKEDMESSLAIRILNTWMSIFKQFIQSCSYNSKSREVKSERYIRIFSVEKIQRKDLLEGARKFALVVDIFHNTLLKY